MRSTASPHGEPVMDRPTLHSLGVYWVVKGDAERDAKVDLQYRKAGADAWLAGYPLFRVETEGQQRAGKDTSGSIVPKIQSGETLYAGSVVMLDPETEYEIKLTLAKDGSVEERLLKGRTIAEPAEPAGQRVMHVIPGSGGGSGSAADPFRGLAAAEQASRPGDTVMVHKGVYNGTFTVKRSGWPRHPIIYRAAGDGEAIIDAGLPGGGVSTAPATRPTTRAAARPGGRRPATTEAATRPARPPHRGIMASGISDVWFEGLTIRNADWGLVAHESARIVIRRCHIHDVEYGMTATVNESGNVLDHFITDNLIEGPSTWPRTKGIEDARAIQITGSGHVIAYNRVIGFADAIDTMPSQRCDSIDIHNNEISEMTDDGIETDYSQRNVRVFHNRLTNIFQGISTQPIFGGPIYIFRNAMYNIEVEPFKLHNSPSGALLFHNTSVKSRHAMLLWTSNEVSNCVSRNNLFLGTEAEHVIEFSAPMKDCDFDYDGVGGRVKRGEGRGAFMVWESKHYATAADVRSKAPAERHLTIVAPARAFASGILPPEDFKVQQKIGHDLRLSDTSEAVDAGQVLPGFNDRYKGKGPDLGAFEVGEKLPWFGPRNK